MLKRFIPKRPLLLLVILGLTAGIIFWATDQLFALQLTAYGVLGVVILLTAVEMYREIRAGHWGLDILAVVAMTATLLVEEYIAGLIIALMLTGGEALEDFAERRASRELDALLDRAPRFVNRLDPKTGDPQMISVDEVMIGDELLIRSNEVIPVDGVLLSDHASIDESSVTGEPLPVSFHKGDKILSGTLNETASFTLRAASTAKDSHYASIIKLVEEAIESRAPMVRLADRYAVPFTIISLLIAGIAWAISGDPVRFAEVLVVATPCPLLIAAPVAFMGGMSSAARINVIVKDSAALEIMSRVQSAAFDKTGTLTEGKPRVARIVAGSISEDKVLALAASAERYSVHVFAEPIVAAAESKNLTIPFAHRAEELATNGVFAVLDSGEEVRVGKPRFIEAVTGKVDQPSLESGETAVFVSLDDKFAGVIILADAVRPQAAEMLKALRDMSINNIALVTGDVAATANSVASELQISKIHAEASPATKVQVVKSLEPKPVLMVGDGINDAPVLASADVGIAMSSRDSTAATESASAVITSNNIARVADVVQVSRHTVRIALQSIWVGIIISVGLMLIAAFGFLPAVVGALMQEIVDLVAILSALRALTVYKKVGSLAAKKRTFNVKTPSESAE